MSKRVRASKHGVLFLGIALVLYSLAAERIALVRLAAEDRAVAIDDVRSPTQPPLKFSDAARLARSSLVADPDVHRLPTMAGMERRPRRS